MITEHTQILCTALHLRGLHQVPMRPTHQKHPCVLWATESFANFFCLVMLNRAYYAEYRRRFENRTHGGYIKMIDMLNGYEPDLVQAVYADRHSLSRLRSNPTSFISTPPQTMPDEYRVQGDTLDVVVQAYRRFYSGSKRAFARYSHSEPPFFMQ